MHEATGTYPSSQRLPPTSGERLEVRLVPVGRPPLGPDYVGRWGMGVTFGEDGNRVCRLVSVQTCYLCCDACYLCSLGDVDPLSLHNFIIACCTGVLIHADTLAGVFTTDGNKSDCLVSLSTRVAITAVIAKGVGTS